MKTACPSCSQSIEIDEETLEALQSSSHFMCPACSAPVPVPVPSSPAVRAPVRARSGTKPAARPESHRNLLILGSAALLMLGGLAVFIASRRGGDVIHTKQAISNEIINNTYFQQLIASGATTERDLEAVTGIRPYQAGFIGMSKEPLMWQEALDLARKAGGEVLEPARGGSALLDWAGAHFGPELAVPVWVGEGGAARILDGREMLVVNELERKRRVLIDWQSGGPDLPPGPAPVITAEVPAVVPPPPQLPEDPWKDFDPGPLVFEDSFTRPESLERAHVIEGQYSLYPEIVSGRGLYLPDGHTWSMVWPRAVLGERCRAEFEVELSGQRGVQWVMKGSGTGNGIESGYGFVLDQGALVISREGRQWLRKKLPIPPVAGTWTRIRVDMRDHHLAVRVNGELVADAAVTEELQGPLHSWLGISGAIATLRGVKVWSTEPDQSLQPRWTPPVTIPPRPNGAEIYRLAEPEGPLGARWSTYHPGGIFVEKKELCLSAYHTNDWPRAMLGKPFRGPMAVEFNHRYVSPQTINFTLLLARAAKAPQKMSDVREIWQFFLPGSRSSYGIRWGKGAELGRVEEIWQNYMAWDLKTAGLASVAYYSPLRDRDYHFRVEFTGETARVFLDGAFLMEGKRPAQAGDNADDPIYIGLNQWYSSSVIRDLRVFQLKAE